MAIPRPEMDAALKATFVPKLRSFGFKGSYPHFRRERAQHVELVGIQFSQWGAQFYVEAGVAENNDQVIAGGTSVSAHRLKYYHGWPRRRFGDLPFDYEAEAISVVAARAAEVVEELVSWASSTAPQRPGDVRTVGG